MAVCDGGDDEFVGVGDALQRFEFVGHLVGIADELRCGAVLHQLSCSSDSGATASGSGYGMAPSPARIEYTQWP